MNTILLEPTDVLFFRDGRPMGGASSGHGAAWPLPTVISHAFHAAFHRSGFESHAHDQWSGNERGLTKTRKFGSLVTVGPFPVCTHGAAHTWFFPRPADADDAGQVILHPLRDPSGASSLPKPWLHPLVSSVPPSKDPLKSWWSEGSWNAYLGSDPRDQLSARRFQKTDEDIAEREHTFGIGMNPDTGSVQEGQFYSASYLRLRPGWQLGVFASAEDKEFEHPDHGSDLVRALLNGKGTEIIAGGQQRVCTATLATLSARLPMPSGLGTGFHASAGGRHLVKWILLTPAVFPSIEAGTSKRGTVRKAHPGGWLPSWICPDTGRVLLQTLCKEERRERRRLNYAGKGYASEPNIHARLVAALTGKPVPVTGYALPNSNDPGRPDGGAKPTHLAVPAGSVYYFEADSPEAAQKLAAALNWHGEGDPTTIRNRRSTLFGEKGFGLGVCGTWNFHNGKPPTS
jgi:CRISPR-associated protein Cmr3